MAEFELATKQITRSDWEKELIGIRADVSIPGYWSSIEENSNQWANEISVCPFWNNVNKNLEKWIAEYRSETGGALLAQPGLPKFIGKGSDRIQTKLYKKRLADDNYKTKVYPKEGPAIPNLHDLVRTRISCKFIDGVEFLANKLYRLSKEMSVYHGHSKEGRLEGYYAQHLNFKENVFYRFGGGTTAALIICEVQIATEMSTLIWDATHAIYEEAREREEDNPAEWQWLPNDPRFVSRQLGHMIHLADGLLVQLREAVKRERS